MTRDVLAPPIVHDNSILNGALAVEPSEEFLGLPVGVGSLPVAVRPQDVRSVCVNQFHHFGNYFVYNICGSGEVALFVREIQWVVPFVERVVEAKV